jgi:hypothetical protein
MAAAARWTMMNEWVRVTCGANSSRGFAAVACPPFDRATSSLCAFRMSSIDHAIGSP